MGNRFFPRIQTLASVWYLDCSRSVIRDADMQIHTHPLNLIYLINGLRGVIRRRGWLVTAQIWQWACMMLHPGQLTPRVELCAWLALGQRTHSPSHAKHTPTVHEPLQSLSAPHATWRVRPCLSQSRIDIVKPCVACLHRDGEHCPYFWTCLNADLFLFQDVADTSTLSFFVFIPFNLFSRSPEDAESAVLFKCPDIFTQYLKMHRGIYSNCPFLWCNNVFLVFSCICHRRPSVTTYGAFA